jgi:hypothetical protein
MSRSAIHLFSSYDLVPNPYNDDKLCIQDLIYYCEVRFRAALAALSDEVLDDKIIWMRTALGSELVSNSKLVEDPVLNPC